jgi:hypothetical protein
MVWMHMEDCVMRVMSACDSPLDHGGCCLAPPPTLLFVFVTHTQLARQGAPMQLAPTLAWLAAVRV